MSLCLSKDYKREEFPTRQLCFPSFSILIITWVIVWIPYILCVLCNCLVSRWLQFILNNDCAWLFCRHLLTKDYTETVYSQDGRQITTSPQIKVNKKGFPSLLLAVLGRSVWDSRVREITAHIRQNEKILNQGSKRWSLGCLWRDREDVTPSFGRATLIYTSWESETQHSLSLSKTSTFSP